MPQKPTYAEPDAFWEAMVTGKNPLILKSGNQDDHEYNPRQGHQIRRY